LPGASTVLGAALLLHQSPPPGGALAGATRHELRLPPSDLLGPQWLTPPPPKLHAARAMPRSRYWPLLILFSLNYALHCLVFVYEKMMLDVVFWLVWICGFVLGLVKISYK
jgi:hypothetical protein